MTAQPLTIDDLRKQFGSPGNRNSADIDGIAAAITPYTERTGNIGITASGQLIPPSDMKAIQENYPDAERHYSEIQDLKRTF